MEYVFLYVYFYLKEMLYSKLFIYEGVAQKAISSGILTLVSSFFIYLAKHDYARLSSLEFSLSDMRNVLFWSLFILSDWISTITFLFYLNKKGVNLSELYLLYDVARLFMMYVVFLTLASVFLVNISL